MSRRLEGKIKKQELKRQAEKKKTTKVEDKAKLEEEKRQEAKRFLTEEDLLPHLENKLIFVIYFNYYLPLIMQLH